MEVPGKARKWLGLGIDQLFERDTSEAKMEFVWLQHMAPVYSSSGCHLISPGFSRVVSEMWVQVKLESCWGWATCMHPGCCKTDVISWKSQ